MKLALITFLSAVTLACAADVPITQDERVRRTQELYDAFVPGNQAPWKKYFADDCIFADETETIFRQNLKARYHVTDTWLQRDGNWHIIASQAHRYYEDPAMGKANPKKFAYYIGTYELAPGQTRSVSAEGDRLFVERNGKKEELLPETSEIFFRKGVEGRILFRYAGAGKVDALIDRRNNEDVIWRKTK